MKRDTLPGLRRGSFRRSEVHGFPTPAASSDQQSAQAPVLLAPWQREEERQLRQARFETAFIVISGGLGLLVAEWFYVGPVMALVFRWVIGLGGVGFVAAVWYRWYQEREATRKKRDQEQDARAPVREEIRWWVSHLEQEYAWLLTTPFDEQKTWAIRRFPEVVKDWKEDNQKFHAMRRKEQFELAAQEVGPPAARMMEIWEARRKLYQFARIEVTPPRRVEQGLETQEEIQQMRVEKVMKFEKFKREQLGEHEDEDDETG